MKKEAKMVDLPRKKVGIIACSGEELPEGTITRLAALRVLEQLRPSNTVTICLPLFLAGGESDRAFARFYPTISIDGCNLRCAERATERYSHKPAARIMVQDVIVENQLGAPEGRQRLNEAGQQAVDLTAEKIASTVDELLGKQWDRKLGDVVQLEIIEEAQQAESQEPGVATCACRPGIPVQNILITGKQVTLVGLPLIFQQYTEAGKFPNEETISELMDTVKIYNPIPAEEEPDYRDGIRNAYKNYWFKGKPG
jgi:uncharacterized metal-binding protein